MSIENWKNIEQVSLAKVEKSEEQVKAEVSQVKKSIDKAKEANRAWDIETQVWPILERFWISEKQIDSVVDKLSKLDANSLQNFVKRLIWYWKLNKPELILKLINSLWVRESNKLNEEKIQENKNNIQENKNNIQENKKESLENNQNTQKLDKNSDQNIDKKNEFKTNTREYETNTREYEWFIQNFSELRNLSEKFRWKPEYKAYADVFRKYESITPENRKEIIRDLKQALSPEVLTKMVQEVWINSVEYKQLKNSLISIEWWEWGYFRSQFEAIEQVWAYKAKEFVSLWVDRNPVIKNADWSLKFENTEKVIKVDENGKRKVSLPWSSYALEADIDDEWSKKLIDEENKKLESELLPINNELSALDTIKKILDNPDNKDAELKDLINYIKENFKDKIDTRKIENIFTKEDLKRYIENREKFLESSKKDKIKEKNQKIGNILVENARKAEELDKNKRKVLKFLKEIWFDLVPQEATDSAINMINSSEHFRKMLGLTWEINITEWKLWAYKEEKRLTLNDQRTFKKLFKKMLTCREDLPNAIDSNWEIRFFSSAADLDKWLAFSWEKKNRIAFLLGSNPKGTIFRNLWLLNK